MVKDESFLELLKSIPKRLLELVVKLLSMKGVVLFLTVWMLALEVIQSWGFLAVVGMVLFDRAFLKYMDKVKG
jgi:hypothetical protein